MIQPAGLGRQARRRPALHRRGEGVLDRVLGDVDVPEDADQDGHGASVLLAEDSLDLGDRQGPARRASVLRYVLERTHLDRQSAHARAPWRPQSSAASRSGAAITQNPPMCSLPSANGPSVIEHLSIVVSHHGGRARRMEAAGEDPRPRALELGVEVGDSQVSGLHLLTWSGRTALDHMHAEHVLLHHVLLSFAAGAQTGLGSTTTWGQPWRLLSASASAYPLARVACRSERQTALARPRRISPWPMRWGR